MKKYLILSSIVFTCLLFIQANAKSVERIHNVDSNVPLGADTISRNGTTLIFINKAEGFADSVKGKMIDVFFKIYPQEMALYNSRSSKLVTFIIDPEYTGVAATSNDIVSYNPKWFEQHPNDIDVVTHEAMHIVQAYPNNPNAPWWITEGIADYVRLTLGVYNKEAGWAVPDYKSTQNYSNSYRVTARFFYWLEKNKKAGIVKTLDKSMRTKTYTDAFWKKETGETIDELWQDYSKQPSIN